MPDGVRLSARLWLPESAATPAIVEYIPYRKRDMVRARDERNHAWFADHGYACIRVDMRGSGDSEGLMPDMYHQNELDDALVVLEWIKNQSWCDGNIGMMGTSWGGTSALQAASKRSGLLKAVIAVCATNNRFDDDIHHMGGCLLTDSVEWGATLPAILALPPASDSDPEGWRENWKNRLDSMESPLFSWIEHETRDAYWKHGAVNESPGQLDCPVLAIGGWSDRYSNTVMNLVSDNPDNCWGIVGPWGHHYPDQGVPGPAIGFQQEALRWWNFWLRGENNGVLQDPQLRVWCNACQPPTDFSSFREGYWRAITNWASNDEVANFDLRCRKGVGDNGFVRVPFNLKVGAAAGDTGYFGRPGGLPLDQSIDDAHSLIIETRELDEQQVLVGKAVVKLSLKAEKLPAQLIIRLSDVSPDGYISRVSWRVQNLALGDDGQLLDPVRSNETVTREFALPNTAYVFEVGHKIRIALSASYWPQILPTTSDPDISVDCHRASLQLSLAPADSTMFDQSVFAESITPINRDPKSVEDRIQRETELNGDALTYRWHQPLVFTHHEQINADIGAETTAKHSINLSDPLSARSFFEHKLTAVYAEQTFETTGSAQVTASLDHYQVDGSLHVKEDGVEIFNRNWSREIPRKHA